MAKLQRKDVKIFSSNPNDATQVSTFLTAKDDTPDYSSDPNAIQNANYTKGWLARGNDDLPQVEDMNGVMYAESYKNAYLYQMGIAEWSASGEYYENSYCQVDGVFYKSLIDNNVNNNPTTDDGTKWEEIPLEPYTGENIGTAEGVYAGKTVNNELQFKGIAVSGNGSISSSDDTITIAIGGGGTGDVYWGAIDGTLSNQSDLQQALNLKQNLIGYTPENVSNKVTTVRTSSVATDTAYASEKATRTAIDNAITSANNYTDSALQTLNSDAFVLYANSWTDIYTGTLTTTAPTGTGTTHTLSYISSSTYEDIANFTYTTTQETTFNSTLTYDVLVPIRNTTIANWLFKFKLTITHADVNAGNPTVLFDYASSDLYAVNGDLNIEIKQDLLDVTSITYPVGSTISFSIKAQSNPGGEASPYNFDLLVYDETNPIVISRNKGINKNLATALNTQALGTEQNQEYFNSYIKNQLSSKQDAISQLTFGTNQVTILNAFDITLDDTDPTQAYLYMSPKNKLNILQPLKAYIGSNSIRMVCIYTECIESDIIRPYTNDYGEVGTSSRTFSSGYINTLNTTTINLKTSLLPQENGTSFYDIDLGSSTKKIYRIFATTTNSTNVQCETIAPTGGKANLRFSYGSGYTAGGIAPTSGLTACNLGTSNDKWANVYSVNLYGTVQGGCDRNKKENIVERGTEKGETKSALEKLKSLKTYTYNFKNDKEKRTHIGVMAQDLREIEPLLVTNISEKKDEEDLYVDIMGYCALLTESIQKLNEKVEYLEMRIEELEGNKEEELKK